MKQVIHFAVLFTVISHVDAQELTRENLPKLIKAAEERKQEQSRTLKNQIKSWDRERTAAKNGKINKRAKSTVEKTVNGQTVFEFPSEAIRNSYISNATNEIARAELKLKHLEFVAPTMPVSGLKVGGIGLITAGTSKRQTFLVLQVIDANNALLRLSDRILWATIPTEGLVDDTEFSGDELVWEVVGTKQYASAIGSTKTVHHVTLVNFPKLIAEARAVNDPAAVPFSIHGLSIGDDPPESYITEHGLTFTAGNRAATCYRTVKAEDSEIELRIAYTFLDKKLAAVAFLFDSKDFAALRDLFATKFGKPYSSDLDVVVWQTKSGEFTLRKRLGENGSGLVTTTELDTLMKLGKVNLAPDQSEK